MREIFSINSQRSPYPVPFELQMAGRSFCDGSYYHHRSEKKGTFVFEYIESGCGKLTVGNATFHPRAGDVYIAPGWREHSYRSDAVTPWVKSWLNLGGSLIEDLLVFYKLSGRYLFRNVPECGKIILEMVDHLRGMVRPEATLYVQSRILELLSMLAQTPLNGTESSLSRNALQIREFMLEHLHTPPPSLDEVCRVIAKSRSQTNRIFQAEFDETPHEFLTRKKLELAANCLANNDMTLRDIAGEIGISDEYYFSRLFKKHYGISPREYRIARRRADRN